MTLARLLGNKSKSVNDLKENQSVESELQQALNYSHEGEEHFAMANYQEAIKSYKLAINSMEKIYKNYPSYLNRRTLTVWQLKMGLSYVGYDWTEKLDCHKRVMELINDIPEEKRVAEDWSMLATVLSDRYSPFYSCSVRGDATFVEIKDAVEIFIQIPEHLRQDEDWHQLARAAFAMSQCRGALKEEVDLAVQIQKEVISYFNYNFKTYADILYRYSDGLLECQSNLALLYHQQQYYLDAAEVWQQLFNKIDWIGIENTREPNREKYVKNALINLEKIMLIKSSQNDLDVKKWQFQFLSDVKFYLSYVDKGTGAEIIYERPKLEKYLDSIKKISVAKYKDVYKKLSDQQKSDLTLLDKPISAVEIAGRIFKNIFNCPLKNREVRLNNQEIEVGMLNPGLKMLIAQECIRDKKAEANKNSSTQIKPLPGIISDNIWLNILTFLVNPSIRASEKFHNTMVLFVHVELINKDMKKFHSILIFDKKVRSNNKLLKGISSDVSVTTTKSQLRVKLMEKQKALEEANENAELQGCLQKHIGRLT